MEDWAGRDLERRGTSSRGGRGLIEKVEPETILVRTKVAPRGLIEVPIGRGAASRRITRREQLMYRVHAAELDLRQLKGSPEEASEAGGAEHMDRGLAGREAGERQLKRILGRT
jgi:hypothetical protein